MNISTLTWLTVISVLFWGVSCWYVQTGRWWMIFLYCFYIVHGNSIHFFVYNWDPMVILANKIVLLTDILNENNFLLLTASVYFINTLKLNTTVDTKIVHVETDWCKTFFKIIHNEENMLKFLLKQLMLSSQMQEKIDLTKIRSANNNEPE